MTVVALEGEALVDASARGANGRTIVEVTDEASAAAALRLAMSGAPLVIHATAPRNILDALYDDLRRLTRVEIRTTAGSGDHLTVDEHEILALLATGLTLNQAAARLHLSQRTAERRLASARVRLGAATTVEAIARVHGRSGGPPGSDRR